METDSPWLTEAQQTVWRSWLATTARLPTALHRELQTDAGLSLADFEVLVRLTESPEARLRVSDLARELTWERSRLSHHVTRMEKRGLVEREECTNDGRGAFVALTAEGRAAIERAAPGHARTVRALVFDQLTKGETEVLGTVLNKALARLDAQEGAPRNK